MASTANTFVIRLDETPARVAFHCRLSRGSISWRIETDTEDMTYLRGTVAQMKAFAEAILVAARTEDLYE